MQYAQQFRHGILPDIRHDEQARNDFVLGFRAYLAGQVAPSNKAIWAQRVGPKFVEEHGREPEDWREAGKAMKRDPSYQFWSCMQSRAQRMNWDNAIDSVERQLPELIDKAKALSGKTGGTLTLDPDLEIPRYLTTHDIHLQPGNYCSEFTEDDIFAGAIYDAGVHVYSMGQMGAKDDHLGLANLGHYQKRFPEADPKRILDMGCTIGQSTLPWAEAFPSAEVHAIDVGAPVLRYAHARAESMGVKVHFSQQDAEHTSFEDESFDVVMSHIMMHETDKGAVARIFGESRRLLKPGGVMLHFDIARLAGLPPVDAFLSGWEIENHYEYFGATYRMMDLVAEAEKGGWQPGETALEKADHYQPGELGNYVGTVFTWPVVVGVKGGA